MTEKRPRTLGDIEKELFEADENLINAKREVARARSAETDALNRINGIQKEFDAAVDALKKNADGGTDWRVQNRRQREDSV